MPFFLRVRCSLSSIAMIVAGWLAATATANTQIVAVTGDAAPDGNGVFSSSFGHPALNDAGQVAFTSILDNTSGGFSDYRGVFRGNGVSLTQIVRTGDPVPDANGTFWTYSNPALNESGQVGFFSSLNNTNGVLSDNEGLYRGDGTTLTQIAREDNVAPDGNGVFLHFNFFAFNNAGQMASRAFLADTSGGTDDASIIFFSDGISFTQIARRGDTSPDGNGSFLFFDHITLNDLGQSAFPVRLTGTSGGSNDDRGIFRGDGTALSSIVRKGETTPDNNGIFFSFSYPTLNNVGQVAFFARLSGTNGGSSDDRGLAYGDGNTLNWIVRRGDATPNGNGTFSDFGDADQGLASSPSSFNNAGQVAFIASLAGTDNGTEDNSGIFRGDGVTLIEIARAGEIAPDDDGRFLAFDRPALNDAGQTAFSASLMDTQNERGIFFFDDELGLIQIARAGDHLLGSTIVSLDTNPGYSNGHKGFNESGQLAYRFTLDDNRSGIALWSLDNGVALLGDYDNDGIVGQGDLSLVLQYWGQAVTDGMPPDRTWLNSNGITGSLIGQNELAFVLQNWGNTSTALSEIESIIAATGLTESQVRNLVPEPACLVLLSFGVFGLASYRPNH